MRTDVVPAKKNHNPVQSNLRFNLQVEYSFPNKRDVPGNTGK